MQRIKNAKNEERCYSFENSWNVIVILIIIA